MLPSGEAIYPSSFSSKNTKEHNPSDEQIMRQEVEKNVRSFIIAKWIFPTTASGVSEAVEYMITLSKVLIAKTMTYGISIILNWSYSFFLNNFWQNLMHNAGLLLVFMTTEGMFRTFLL